MSERASANPPVSRDDERRWFRRTIVAAVGICAGLATGAIAVYLLSEFNVAFSTLSRDVDMFEWVNRKLAPIRALTISSVMLLAGSGAGFLACFIKWLLAIRRRRALEAAYFGASPPLG